MPFILTIFVCASLANTHYKDGKFILYRKEPAAASPLPAADSIIFQLIPALSRYFNQPRRPFSVMPPAFAQTAEFPAWTAHNKGPSPQGLHAP